MIVEDKKSIYRGVNWHRTCKKWIVYIGHNHKRITVGYFDNEIEGALAYNVKAIELNGDKAKLNFENNDKFCEVCGEKALYKYKNEQWLCKKHISQMSQNGKILVRTKFDLNEIIKTPSYSEILLYNKNNEECARTIIDNEDVELIKQYKWYLRADGYVASSSGLQNFIYLHRIILNENNNRNIIDHIDRNKLNNLKKNLRVANSIQNGENRGIRIDNTSGKIGVYWVEERGKWGATIGYNNKNINLGCFTYYEDAVSERINAEIKYFKEFRVLNEKEIGRIESND